jgi:hypothetical protein
MSERWTIRYKPAARRALAEDLPEEIAAAAYELITGALAENPHRVGKPPDLPEDAPAFTPGRNPASRVAGQEKPIRRRADRRLPWHRGGWP